MRGNETFVVEIRDLLGVKQIVSYVVSHHRLEFGVNNDNMKGSVSAPWQTLKSTMQKQSHAAQNRRNLDFPAVTFSLQTARFG